MGFALRLRRYGFNTDADRVSYEFLSAVAENFRRDGKHPREVQRCERAGLHRARLRPLLPFLRVIAMPTGATLIFGSTTLLQSVIERVSVSQAEKM
jgi:hypothetical protein